MPDMPTGTLVHLRSGAKYYFTRFRGRDARLRLRSAFYRIGSFLTRMPDRPNATIAPSSNASFTASRL
jgi:hypothetical protein